MQVFPFVCFHKICDFLIGQQALKKCHSGSFLHAFCVKKSAVVQILSIEKIVI
jgi:hypothetical protein